MDVFVLVEFVEELLDIHHLFISEADGAVGEALEVGFDDVDFTFFKGVVHHAVVSPGSVDGSCGGAFFLVGFGDNLVQTEVDEFKLQLVFVHASGHLNLEHSLAGEHEFQ